MLVDYRDISISIPILNLSFSISSEKALLFYLTNYNAFNSSLGKNIFLLRDKNTVVHKIYSYMYLLCKIRKFYLVL